MERDDYSFEDYKIARWRGGAGPSLLLIHGSGPGASTAGNWRLVLEPLSKHFSLTAFDLVGFGESGRLQAEPFFDADLWRRQIVSALNGYRFGEANILAHSLSGSLALDIAANDTRIGKLMTTGSMGASIKLNPHLERVWSFPRNREEIKTTAASLVFDTSVITEDYIAGREAVLCQDNYRSYFGSMFGGDKQNYINAVSISSAKLADIACRVCLVHGRNDLVIPFYEAALPLLASIPQADLIGLANCGHSPAIEHPERLVALATSFFS